ncbi:MAG: FAD-dependent oxidoreductase [Planctomycetota bacterium]|jgi:hypothetical protein|nr:FAD-dependent oxidoreductase [Planctomycetota bacterium]
MSHRTATAHRDQHRYDVCVVGGGMSGVCAAIAAARNGARTCLVQDRAVLGGNASSEIRMWICGAHGANTKETGILEEIQLANLARNPAGNFAVWDAVLHDAIATQPNLDLFLNCSCTGTEADGPDDARVLGAITCWQLTTQTWHRIEATTFIDCSGDGVLALDSGAWFMQGREAMDAYDEDIQPSQADNRTMGNSILLQIEDTGKKVSFTPAPGSYRFSKDDFPFRLRGVKGNNFWWVELGGLNDTILDAERIRGDLHAVIWGVWDYIKNVAEEKDEAATWDLHWIGALPGKRENRRFVGHHVLNQNDVRTGSFNDVIAYGGWSMDDHHPAGMMYPGKPTVFHSAPSPYGIPLRSLISRNVRNLLFAGRNISATHAALSSTRVMATCALLGQAAGSAAALATRHRCLPAAIASEHIAELQQALLHDDVWLPGRQRPINPLSQSATCDAPVLLSGNDRPLSDDDQQQWRGSPGEAISFSWSSPQQVGGLRMVCDSNLKDLKRMPCQYPAQLKLPDELLRSFRVEVDRGDGTWHTAHRCDNNIQRFISIPDLGEATGLRIVPESTWGQNDSIALYAAEAVHQLPERSLPDLSRPLWANRCAQVAPSDLAPPENTGNGRNVVASA